VIKLLLVFLLILSPFNKVSEFEKDCIEQVNALRKQERTKPLSIDPKLSAQCQRYARKLARTGKFEHDPRLRNNVGENIAMSSDPSIDPIEIWKHSTGHRQNILSRDYETVGIAKASNNANETYYVMRLK